MVKAEHTLFSIAYFPPIQYFTHLISASYASIEVQENYIKQTYRNRCKIYSPNGIQVLSVPVERGSFHKTPLKELKIDYSKPWQINHLRALKTAYNSSAFYEFMIDDIEECITLKHDLLLDLNLDILRRISKFLEFDVEINRTVSFIAEPTNIIDLRSSLHPKKQNREFLDNIPEYFQVFSYRFGFIPDLSILDLLFNMGPESSGYLQSCIKRERPTLS